jgi:ABC-type Mn2+/Zn2+ transport system permease subunit
MQRKILWLTAKKVGKFFLVLLTAFVFGVLSMLAGTYFFDDPTKGLSVSLFVAMVIFAIVFAYDHSKWEVEREQNDLIRKIKK